MSVRSFALLTFIVVLCSASWSTEQSVHLEIENAWARPSPPGAPSAGFMVIKNTGSENDVLLGVAGDFAAKLEVHRSRMVDGVMKMEHQSDGVVIPAGEQVVFQPGGYHLMFMGLNKNFAVGDIYRVTLTFREAGKLEVTLPVQSISDAVSGSE